MKYKIACESINQPVAKKHLGAMTDDQNTQWNIIENRKFLDTLTTTIFASVIPFACVKIPELKTLDCFSRCMCAVIILLAAGVIIAQIYSSRQAIKYSKTNKSEKLKRNERYNSWADLLFVLLLIASLIVAIYNLFL